MSTPNVFVKVGTTMAKVQPVRAVLVKHQLEQASKVKTAQQFRAALQRRKDGREYPKHTPGMSTEQYVKAYLVANRNLGLAGQAEDFFEPLSTNPQYTPLFDGVEESI